MPRVRQDLPLGEAAQAIGVSMDTLRRWDKAGKLRTTRDARNRRLVPAGEVRRLSGRPPRRTTGAALSARNRFPGVVRSVEVEGVMALVEMEAGPFRVTAAVTRDAVEELGLAEGVEAVATVKATSVMVERGGGVGRRLASLAGLILAVMGVLPLALSGCGGGGSGSGGQDLRVSAAASLKRAFTAYGARFEQGQARFQFAGSDELAAQIGQGARPDLFAAANTKLPDQLYAAGLVERPQVFASNRLVLAVPAGATKVRSLQDLSKPGTTIAAGSPSVPVGSYTREVLDRLPAARERAILANVRSNEPDVAGVVGKLSQGAVDAGFVYVTDVTATEGRLRAIELRARLRPRVAFAAAVVKGAPNRSGARAFLAGLRSGAGAQELKKAGFGPPPAAR